MKVRFHVTDTDGNALETTDWAEENSRDVPVSMVTDLRTTYGPEARIVIERNAIILNPKPKTFRFDIKVRSGTVTVVDDDGTNPRDVSGLTLHSRPFQRFEQEKVLAELREKFPNATIIERES